MTETIYENPDLKNERLNLHFNKEEITNLIDGGADKTKERRELEEFILSDGSFNDVTPTEYLSHAEKYSVELKKACLLFKKFTDPSDKPKDLSTVALFSTGTGAMVLKEGNPLALHFAMFLPALSSMCSPEQQEKWLPKAYNLQMIGTYAQTELGHGTFLRGLETKATYDQDAKQFILESPSLTAYKWWPGGLGHTVNYAIVMAQLYTRGKCEGIHPFLVQLRDEDTHEPLPGIRVGEIGHKLGFNSVNNGYLGFEKVRIPREHLLMRHSQVLEDGTYVKPPSTKLGYGAMVFVRVLVIQDIAVQLRKAVTIATRYSCIRRQSEIKPGSPEPQIIEYGAQQNKLFPPLAATFGFHFAAKYVWELYNTVNDNISKGDLHLMPDLHILSCALKALSSTEASKHVEILRQSCGGHGYMACSNFPRIFSMVTAAQTYEGENTVLWLQVAKYLIKTYMDKLGGKNVTYLTDVESINTKFSELNLESIINLFRKVAFGLVDVAARELQVSLQQGMAPYEAWNQSAIVLVKAAQAHARFVVADCFVRSVQTGTFSAPVRLMLTQLCELYLIYWVTERTGDFLMFTEIKADQLLQLQTKYVKLLHTVRTYAVNLVDSFDFRDEALGSALGCWDGNAYQRLFDEAGKSPLNQTSVHRESFEKYLKPLMNSNL